jgi:signal transduction histidine kinase
MVPLPMMFVRPVAASSGWLGLLLFAAVLAAPRANAHGTADVLVVYSQGRLLPANIQVDAGLNQSSVNGGASDLRFFAEFLDVPEFSGEEYEARTADYLRQKYAGRPPRLVVGGGYVALNFLVRHRDAMFPGAPIVHVAVDGDFLKKKPELSANALGIPVDYDVAGTVDLGLQLHPNARRVVVVNGVGPWSRDREAEFRDVLEQRRLSLPVEYLSGLGSDALLARLRALDSDTIVYTPGFYRDGDGHSFIPLESVKKMVAASAAPIYTIFASQLGSGVVGGKMTSFTDMGRATRAFIEDILQSGQGLSGATRPAMAAPVQLDWRQVRRWGVPQDRIPQDAVIHFREPSLWQRYRFQAMAAVVVILGQAGLIAALLLEHRRRRVTARALADSERRVSVAAHAAGLSTFVWELDGTAQASESLDEVLQAVHAGDRDRLRLAVRRAIDHHEELDIEFRTIAPSGEVRWFAARGHLAADAPRRLTGVSMDISERKSTELQAAADRAALTHMARVSTMGQLSAAIAHQLNQPLAAILGNAETARKLLDRQELSREELREILDDIISEDSRAAEVIRNLGALYRRDPFDRTAFDLNELVRETLDLLRAELVIRHITARFELAAKLPTIEGSRIQIQQVLLNLVLNAADAMNGAQVSQRLVIIRSTFEHGHARLCVVDHGSGMAPEAIQRVFDPFWTTKTHGLGVGLAICHAIVEAHRGTMTASNNAEGGATFCFTLPALAPATASGSTE